MTPAPNPGAVPDLPVRTVVLLGQVVAQELYRSPAGAFMNAAVNGPGTGPGQGRAGQVPTGSLRFPPVPAPVAFSLRLDRDRTGPATTPRHPSGGPVRVGHPAGVAV